MFRNIVYFWWIGFTETGIWYAFAQPLGFVVFLIASFAEAARLPFDLPEAEQELVGGYHTEYAGIKLLLFLVSEFLHNQLTNLLGLCLIALFGDSFIVPTFWA